MLFDTETTGLPLRWDAPMHDLENWPRVIQLAWIITDETGKLESSNKYLIKPDGWSVPNEDFWIRHGYSTEKCEREGIPMTEALWHFLIDYEYADLMVAHNMNYDRNVLGAEMIRYNRKASKNIKAICTKELGTGVVKIPGRYEGSYKWPKLEELYRFLFQKDFDGSHDALNDVMATSECFFELARRGHIDLSAISKV